MAGGPLAQRDIPRALRAPDRDRSRPRAGLAGRVNASGRRAATDSVFLVPGLLLFAAFLVYPTLQAFYYAFTNWNGLAQDADFVGLANFRRILTDPTAWGPVGHTLLFPLVTTVLGNVLALTIAIAVTPKHPVISFFRTFFLIPLTLSTVGVGYIWSYIYNPHGGTLNAFLDVLGAEGLQRAWLGDPNWTLWFIILASLWQSVGVPMVIYLAGLQGVPEDLREAARIDGASAWREFRYVVFPLLAPAVTIAVPFGLINGLKVFDIVYVMTGGGPGRSTETLATNIVRRAFLFQEPGYATALGVVLFTLVLIIGLGSVTLLRRREVSL